MKLAKMNFIVDISAGIFVYYPYSPDLPSGSFLEMDKKLQKNPIMKEHAPCSGKIISALGSVHLSTLYHTSFISL